MRTALRLLCVIPLLMCSITVSAGDGGATARSKSNGDRNRVFREFLLLFYPEVKQKPWVSLAVREDYAFSSYKRTEVEYWVWAYLSPPDCGPMGTYPGQKPPEKKEDDANSAGCSSQPMGNNNPAARKSDTLIVESRFRLDYRTGEIKRYWDHCAFNYNKQLNDIWRQMRQHPEWNDEEALQALRKTDAKFGPWNRSGLLSKVPIAGLTPLLGKLRLKSAKFHVQFRNEPAEEDDVPIPDMLWEVRLERVGSPGSYLLTFEPFEGKLVGLKWYP